MRKSTAYLLHFTALTIIAARPAAAHVREGEVALTFDDLPALTILPDQSYVDYTNATIVRKLRHHHFPAIGFVNEQKVDALVADRQMANLKLWLDGGMELGNHTYSHLSLNEAGPDAYIQDIVRGELRTNALLASRHERMRFFRAPYLETGKSAAIKSTVERWLAAHAYRVAPVTIDADDWEFAEPYDDAIARRDTAAQNQIRREYLEYTKKRIIFAEASARMLFGREIRHVMLLHCTRLNADTLDALAALLRRRHLKPVTLAHALEDPVYAEPDTYTGGDGIDWLERWAVARHRDLPEEGSADPPRDIQIAYDRVDNDRR